MRVIEFPLERAQPVPRFDLCELSELMVDISELLRASKRHRSLRFRNETIDLAAQAMELASAALGHQLTSPG